MPRSTTTCDACGGPLPPGSRANRRTCSDRCRQRLRRGSASVRPSRRPTTGNPAANLTPPSDLGPVALEAWNRLTVVLSPCEEDLVTLERYVRLLQEHADHVATIGEAYVIGGRAHPLLRRVEAVENTLYRLEGRLGLVPVPVAAGGPNA